MDSHYQLIDNLCEMNVSTFDEMMMMARFLNYLKWTDDEIKNLPKQFTDLRIHIALELTDLNNDKENFYKILNRKNKKYKKLFEKHVILTEFDYNYYDF